MNSAQILEVPCLILAEVYNTTKTEQIRKKKQIKNETYSLNFCLCFYFVLLLYVGLSTLFHYALNSHVHVYIIDKEIMQYKTSFDITMISRLTPVYPKCA